MNNAELVKEFQGIVNQLRQLPLPSSNINQRAQSEVQRLSSNLQALVDKLPQHFLKTVLKDGQSLKLPGTAQDYMATPRLADNAIQNQLSALLTSLLPAEAKSLSNMREWSLRLSLSTEGRTYTVECGTYPLDSVDNSITATPDPSSTESVSACCLRAFDTHGNEHDTLCPNYEPM